MRATILGDAIYGGLVCLKNETVRKMRNRNWAHDVKAVQPTNRLRLLSPSRAAAIVSLIMRSGTDSALGLRRQRALEGFSSLQSCWNMLTSSLAGGLSSGCRCFIQSTSGAKKSMS